MSKSSLRSVIGIGIVFNRFDEILIDQRLHGQTMGGLWEFPGGKKELNEDIEQTISREIFEELGVHIHVGKQLLAFNYIYTRKQLHFVVHLCKILSGTPKPLASQKLLWVPPKNLVNYQFPEANDRIIASLFEHLGIQV